MLASASPTPPGKIEEFLSSGTFFVALGLLLLLAAYVGLSFGVHTSFSFVLVVLGVAILLYGTGTQGIGKLDSDVAKGRYSVAIAGGAGVLAMAIGFGMIEKGRDIQTVFDLETRHVKVKLIPSGGDFSRYWVQFTVDGVPIPSANQGDSISFLMPYYYNDKLNHKTVTVNYKLRPQDPTIWNDSFRKIIDEGIEVPLGDINENNSGADFPEVPKPFPVNLRSSETEKKLLQAGAEQQLPPAAGTSAPSSVPPAVPVSPQ
jgi:hypothetical protein